MALGNLRVSSLWGKCHPLSALPLSLVTAILLISGICTARAQRGALTLPRNLAELSATANQIVQGRVVSAQVEAHPDYKNLKTVLISLQVDDVLKGGASKTLTFRQFIWDIRDISDVAGYRVGDEVLLFLNRPTSLGLISPVGLEQGRFRVVRSSTGESVAINGNGNSGLLSGLIESGTLNTSKLSPASRSTVRNFRHGAITLSALKESTRALLQNSARPR